ncbi:group ii intron reverse transcriptase maturase [Brachionus plicatilis]|uniref:Group ii intron reverse transcriptase maturase n=1 Tax=Brachionus plicatilis TaxID=10195 RepID=A0A3M7QGX9_BRAPC|nr:group ii intron reverse transcriptase maturase [Brachionus plicatilis]
MRYAHAACASVLYGVVSKEDGDIELTNISIELSDEEQKSIIPSKEQLEKVLNCIISTKVNWWLTNHHTGQGRIQGYAREMARVVFHKTEQELDEPGLVEFVNTVGHWCSTCLILKKLGVKGVRAVQSLHPIKDLNGTDDLRNMLNHPPAGTGRLKVAFSAIKHLIVHHIAPFCSVIVDAPKIVFKYKLVMNDPAKYHIRAKYLTGDDRVEFDDQEAAFLLGRLGTFIKHFALYSSLACSPHLSVGSGRNRIWKNTDYRDYDASFDELCRIYKSRSMNVSGETSNRMLLDQLSFSLGLSSIRSASVFTSSIKILSEMN